MRIGAVDTVLKLMLDGVARTRSDVAAAAQIEPRAATVVLDTMKRQDYVARVPGGYVITPTGVKRTQWIPQRLRSPQEKSEIRKRWKTTAKAPKAKVEADDFPRVSGNAVIASAMKGRHPLELAWGGASA